MTAYTIKPLEWKQDKYCWVAETVIGRLVVFHTTKIGWYWNREPVIRFYLDSVDDAKAEAEEWFRNTLLPALVPVPDGAQVVGVHYNPNPEGRT